MNSAGEGQNICIWLFRTRKQAAKTSRTVLLPLSPSKKGQRDLASTSSIGTRLSDELAREAHVTAHANDRPDLISMNGNQISRVNHVPLCFSIWVEDERRHFPSVRGCYLHFDGDGSGFYRCPLSAYQLPSQRLRSFGRGNQRPVSKGYCDCKQREFLPDSPRWVNGCGRQRKLRVFWSWCLWHMVYTNRRTESGSFQDWSGIGRKSGRDEVAEDAIRSTLQHRPRIESSK